MTLTILASLGLLLGLVLFILGLRGRVAQRGRFCRRCRFDLAGINLGAEQPKCPECGTDLTLDNATRPTLRRKRRVVLVLGLVLLLAGLTLMSISVTSKTARVLAVLPDRVVLALNDLGMDAAYTEIATNRLTKANSLSDNTWAKLIQTALDHQADTNIVWDPRDGEVLIQAFINARLTPEQIEQYFDNGLEAYAQFTDEIRFGAAEIGVTLTVRPTGRLSSLGTSGGGALSDGTDEVWNRLEITAGGLVDPVFEVSLKNYAGYTGLDIPGIRGGGSGSIGAKISLSQLNWDSIKPGEEYTFFLRYKVGVARMSDGHIHQQREGVTEQRVRILPSDSQLVALDTHPDLIASFQDHATIRLTALHIFPIEKRRQYGPGVHLGRLGTICNNLPIVVAGRVIAIFEGQEYEIGQVTLDTIGAIALSGVQWTIKDPLPEPVIDTWLKAGRVTIEIRPDPRLAEKLPGVKRIFGLPLRFEDVVVTREPPDDNMSSMPHPDQRVGRVVTDPTSEPAPGQDDRERTEP